MSSNGVYNDITPDNWPQAVERFELTMTLCICTIENLTSFF